jgi:uncharacterized protein (DUF488 family)
MTHTVWTIGHSTRPIEDFLALLRDAEITSVADVRRYPGSRRHPQFNREALTQWLSSNGVDYLSLPELGGRREPRENSTNNALRNAGFRGYADYMETAEFERGVERMLQASENRRLAIMCSEAAWTDCHRSLIADYLKARGYRVIHIVCPGKQEEHPFTRAANVVNGRLTYALPFLGT